MATLALHAACMMKQSFLTCAEKFRNLRVSSIVSVASFDLSMHVRQWKDESEKIKERFLREKLSHIKIDL